MAIHVLNNAYVTIGGTDLSAYVKEVRITDNYDQLDPTAMGDTARRRKKGLQDWTVEVRLLQDFAALAVDAVLSPLVGADTCALVIRPTDAAKSATNPEWGGNGYLASYSPIGGTVGNLHETTVTFLSNGALSRSV